MGTQSSGRRYGLPLEQILAIEFEILSRAELQVHLEVIRRTAERMSGWEDIALCAKAFQELQTLIQDALATYEAPPSSIMSPPDVVSPSSEAPLNRLLRPRHSSRASVQIHTRRHGLLLNSLYVPQLCSWLITDILNTTQARLLIAKSELVFHDRVRFFFDKFVPFLHPNRSDIDRFFDSNSSEVAKELPIANKKPVKIKWADISNDMTLRVRRFFDEVPIQPLLAKLGQINVDKYVIAPALSGEDLVWWTASDA